MTNKITTIVANIVVSMSPSFVCTVYAKKKLDFFFVIF